MKGGEKVSNDILFRCPTCGKRNFIYNRESGEFICRECGTVIYKDNIDLGPEWRAYSEEHVERRKRIGAPLSYLKVDLGLTTYPSIETEDKKIHQPPLSYKERKLQIILNELERISEKLKLKKVEKETAAQIVRKAVADGIIKRRTKPATIAAAGILLSCRLYNTPISLREISRAIFNNKVKEQQIAKVYRQLVKLLGVKVKYDADQQLLNLIFRKMEIEFNPEVYNTALNIIRSARQMRIGSGKSPNSLVAAALYLSLKLHGINITQFEVAKLSNTTEVTVRSRIKEIMSHLDIVIEL